MKKTTLFTLLMALLIALPGMSWGQIISQYVETDSGTTPKGIEIFNNTAGELDFAANNLVIQKGGNGGALADVYTLDAGTLASGAVIVIGTADMEATAVANGAAFYLKGFSFNGDDALAVLYGGVTIDVFGEPGSDPGSEWTGNGVSTKNQNIQLLSTITTGDTDGWTDPSERFETVSTTPSGVDGLVGFGLAPEAPSLTCDVTFQVDMQLQVVGANGVHLAGNFASAGYVDWDPAGIEMTDADLDDIYEVTLTLDKSTDYEFKYINGNAWGEDELVPAACSSTGFDGGNRMLSVGANNTQEIDVVCFAKCITCFPPTCEVTFKVDMQNEVVATTVFIAGDFNAWADGAMVNTSGTIWEATVTCDQGSVVAYKFKNGAAGWEDDFTGMPCASGNNRGYTVPAADDATADLVCFNSCSACPATTTIPYDEQFVTSLGDCYSYNESGDTKEWYWYAADEVAAMNGYNSGDLERDWLILPQVDISAAPSLVFTFDSWYKYGTDDADNYLKVVYSTDYAGIGDPTAATWTDLIYNAPGAAEIWTGSGDIDLSAIVGTTLNIAFLYNYESGSYRNWNIDNLLINLNVPETTSWSGDIDGDWANADNWSDGVPGATTDVTIPAGLTNYPTISAAASANTIAIAEGATLLGSENLTLTGDATFTQSLSGGADVYHMISAPVFEPTAISVFPATSFVRSYDETTTNWVNLTGADPLEKAVGYSLNIPEAGDHPITYTGALNTATVSSGALSLTGAIVGYSGWHLLGNPFAAALEYSAGTWNETSVENFVNVWSGVQYLTSDSDLPSNIIPVGQAFFVKATVDGGSIDIPLDACVHNSTSVYKESRTNYFALNITNDANSYSDNTFVRFGQAYANEYDAQDATKMYGLAAAPQIYTMEAEHKLKINSRRSAESIDLNFEAGVEATYTFTVSEFSIDGKVMLEDKVNDITVELEGASTYEFTAMPSDPANRFVLHFDGLTAVEDMALEGINVYAANDVIYVNNAASEAAEITVFSITGQEIMSTTAAQGLNSLRINGASGNYLVQVKNASGIMTEKVFVQ